MIEMMVINLMVERRHSWVQKVMTAFQIIQILASNLLVMAVLQIVQVLVSTHMYIPVTHTHTPSPSLSLSLSPSPTLSFHTSLVCTCTCTLLVHLLHIINMYIHVHVLLCYTCTITHAKKQAGGNQGEGSPNACETADGSGIENISTSIEELRYATRFEEGFNIPDPKYEVWHLDLIIPMWIAVILVFLFLKPPLPTHLLHSHPPHPHNPCHQLREYQPNQLCHTNHHQPLQAGQIKYPRTNVHLSLTC